MRPVSTSEPPKQYDYDVVWRDVYGDIQKYGPCHHHMCRILRRMLSRIEYGSVLDVGCGCGHNYTLLTKNGAAPRFGGIDISDYALEIARKTVPGEFRQCDIQQEHLQGQWDLVVCSLVLEHLADDTAAIRHMRFMTKHYLLVTSIAGDFERYRKWDETQGHVRNYRVGELEQKLREGGFRIRESIYWGYPFYSPIGRTLQNQNQMGLGAFTWRARAAAKLATWLYYLNSSRRGDMVFVLAETT
jgi:SAM-dependent methyltransferase